MRVVAVATPGFALPTLDILLEARGIDVLAVITNPDRPRGRGLDPGAPAAKTWAARNGVPFFQPQKLTRAELEGCPGIKVGLDALVVVASAFYVPTWLRDLPRWGAVNLHPSLLPELRGAAPISWAIINGLTETGVSTMRLADEMDAGDILLQKSMPILGRDTAGSLAPRLAHAGAKLILQTLRGLAAGEIEPTPQDAARATHAPKITAETRAVDWGRPAEELDRLVRGLHPAFSARVSLGGVVIQILDAVPVKEGEDAGATPGTIIAVSEEGIDVACRPGALRLVRIKPAGKQEMAAAGFAAGRRLEAGARFDRLEPPPQE
jgi:methionyl-tRNA formyltransferase